MSGTTKAMQRSMARERIASDRKEMSEYRSSPKYFGYEDYSPSGRAAIREYNKTGNVKDAQRVQRSVMNEGRRETRGRVDPVKLKSGGMVRGCGMARKGHGKGSMK